MLPNDAFNIAPFYDKIVALDRQSPLDLETVSLATQAYIDYYLQFKDGQNISYRSQYQAVSIIHSLASWEAISESIKDNLF